MKKLFLVLFLIPNLISAEANTVVDEFPIATAKMVIKYPHIEQMNLDCFASPKIILDACRIVAEIDHQGASYAQHNLGFSYEQGVNGVNQDIKQAFYWYQKSANHGNMNAQYNLGRLYEFGYGVTRNFSKAGEWYLSATKKGSIEALERGQILSLVGMNLQVKRGVIKLKEKDGYIKTLKPWQIDEANTIYKQLISP